MTGYYNIVLALLLLVVVVLVVLVVALVQLFVVVGCRRWRGRGKDRGELLSLSPTQGDYITCSITDEPREIISLY